MKVLFLIPYPLDSAASQRFRFEQYLPVLKSKGIEYRVSPFLTKSVWDIFYKRGNYFKKILGLKLGVFRRLGALFSATGYDYIFIHREVLPIGPPIIEWLLVNLLGKQIIYDFDDAIWISNSSESNRFFASLKKPSNVFKICQLAHKVSVGNEYLKSAVSSQKDHVVVNPTTIDTVNMHNVLSNHENEKLVIGWTGSHSTIKYLNPLFPIIRRLKERFDFDFLIISDESPKTDQDLFQFLPWTKESEIEDLLRINIGVMPLTHDPWSEGKCGFKALQYMALGIPALVSAVGVNEEIVDHGRNGFICKTPGEWETYILELIQDRDRIRQLGKAAREKVELKYSVHSNTSNFLHLFA